MPPTMPPNGPALWLRSIGSWFCTLMDSRSPEQTGSWTTWRKCPSMPFAFCGSGICRRKYDITSEIHPIEIRIIAGQHRGSPHSRDVALVPRHHDPWSSSASSRRPIAQKGCKTGGNEEPREYPSCLHSLIERPSMRSVQPLLCRPTIVVRRCGHLVQDKQTGENRSRLHEIVGPPCQKGHHFFFGLFHSSYRRSISRRSFW